MFEKLSDNLNGLMAEAGLNASELARLTGIPASTIKKIRNRNNPNPTLTTLLPIARQFNVSLTQLVGDDNGKDHCPANGILMHSDQKKVPTITWAESLTWPEMGGGVRKMVAIDGQYSDATYALEVTELDWIGFAEKSIVIIDPLAKPKHRGYVLVYKQGQVIPTLRQMLLDDGLIYFKSVVDGSHVITSSSQCKMLGVVVEYRNKLID